GQSRSTHASTCEDLHHTRDGVGTVQHARWPAHHLDALHVVRREIGEVERASGIVHWHAIHEHFHILTLAAAQEQRGGAAECPGLHDRPSWDPPERIGYVLHALALERFAGDHGHGGWRIVECDRDPRGGHDDGSDARRILASERLRDEYDRARD